jgi:hypothetical protein
LCPSPPASTVSPAASTVSSLGLPPCSFCDRFTEAVANARCKEALAISGCTQAVASQPPTGSQLLALGSMPCYDGRVGGAGSFRCM